MGPMTPLSAREYVDPIYEFDCPKYVDFTTLEQEEAHVDDWFSYATSASITPPGKKHSHSTHISKILSASSSASSAASANKKSKGKQAGAVGKENTTKGSNSKIPEKSKEKETEKEKEKLTAKVSPNNGVSKTINPFKPKETAAVSKPTDNKIENNHAHPFRLRTAELAKQLGNDSNPNKELRNQRSHSLSRNGSRISLYDLAQKGNYKNNGEKQLATPRQKVEKLNNTTDKKAENHAQHFRLRTAERATRNVSRTSMYGTAQKSYYKNDREKDLATPRQKQEKLNSGRKCLNFLSSASKSASKPGSKPELTEPKEFHLSTDARAAIRKHELPEQSDTYTFRARPLPFSSSSSALLMSERSHTRNVSRNSLYGTARKSNKNDAEKQLTTPRQKAPALNSARKCLNFLPSASKSASKRNSIAKLELTLTEPKEFHLSTDARAAMRKHELHEKSESFTFRARPLPLSSSSSALLMSPTSAGIFIPQPSSRPPTVPEDIQLHTSSRAAKRLHFERMHTQGEPQTEFHARPLPLSSSSLSLTLSPTSAGIFVPQPSQRPPIVPGEIQLHSDVRAEERGAWDSERMNALRSMEEIAAKAKMENERQEKERVKQLRSTLVHHPAPLPKFYQKHSRNSSAASTSSKAIVPKWH